ncbi:hypothetical protein DPEC_G00097130 [Dallia pectoralis]|uniref:Uncharacterized protein n=1 Tax=Dallia pectoralis TaxID=75939 RepID=A0ACC2GVC4_DALPE|nr:hypothetical protein DPEC_G00097130 [Dallia pectoralis]
MEQQPNNQDKRLETVEATHSEPWNKPSLCNNMKGHLETWAHLTSGNKPLNKSKPGLEQMQTYQECLKLIRQLAEDVQDISKLSRRRGVMDDGGPTASSSLESSRSLILQWAEELNHLAPLQKTSTSTSHVHIVREKTDLDEGKDKKRKYIRSEGENPFVIEWAKELKNASEISGLTDKDIHRLLSPQAVKKPRLASVLPLLEFFAWTLMSEDNQCQEDVLKLWLSTKQRAAISTGRHYWEVELSANSGWRLGVTDVNAPRNGVFHMTPANGFWTLLKGTQNILWACDEPRTKITLQALPRIVGVYLDFEEGQVSFYDVTNRVHIYMFSDTFKGSVVPVFGCHDGDTNIRILPQKKMLSTPTVVE